MATSVTSPQGWGIRDYDVGDYYVDIYCPHGRAVDVINTDHKPIDPKQALVEFLAESAEWRHNYCIGH